jgi:hypothetical protein
MPGRIAACAAAVFLWPICTPASDGDGPPLLRPEIVINAVPQLTRAAHAADAKADMQTPPLQGTTPEANASSASQNASASEAEPFGLDAQPVVAGDILIKWGAVEAQIQAEAQVLARCRGGSRCPNAAQRFLAIVNDGQAQICRTQCGRRVAAGYQACGPA